jgi:hypothetical protein
MTPFEYGVASVILGTAFGCLVLLLPIIWFETLRGRTP